MTPHGVSRGPAGALSPSGANIGFSPGLSRRGAYFEVTKVSEIIHRWRSTANGGTFQYVDEDHPLPTTGGGGGGGGAVTIADGADVAQGTTTDVAYVSGSGTLVSILKGIFGKFGAVVLAAGSALIGKVGIDQTTPGTTNAVALAQINAATTLAGNGVTGTGAQRVTIASDNSALPAAGQGATAATAPAGATQIGQRAATVNPTAVTDGQMVGSMADKVGRTATVPFGIRDLAGDQTTSLSNTTSETTIVTAVGSTLLDLLSLTCANTGATATPVDIRDTTGGSVRYTLYVPAGETRGIVFSSPLKQAAVNTNWTAQCANATTAMKITAQYTKNV